MSGCDMNLSDILATCGTDVTAIEVCGQGATGCSGYVLDPLCQCNSSMFYLPAADGRSCVPGKVYYIDILQFAK